MGRWKWEDTTSSYIQYVTSLHFSFTCRMSFTLYCRITENLNFIRIQYFECQKSSGSEIETVGFTDRILGSLRVGDTFLRNLILVGALFKNVVIAGGKMVFITFLQLFSAISD